jgi:5-(carboxyamino)imidazole ribonucleotide synthase
MKDLKTGILGGGQLGLMMVQACSDFHMEPTFLDPDPEAASKPYGNVRMGSFRDYPTVLAFGKEMDLVSFEIEDVNLEALKALEEEGVQVFPQPRVLEIIRDKWRQKEFLLENGFPTSPFIAYDPLKMTDYEDFLPAFWKQKTGGYDGKGVASIDSVVDLEKLPDVPGFLEKAVAIEKEVAVIVARNSSGEVRAFPCVEMVFHPEANLVAYLQAPAQISEEKQKECTRMAEALIRKMEMVGLLAVEFFINASGKVLVNEMAPRPHNSGHHTIEGNLTSQFQQFWRAILDLPLGDTRPIHPFAAMVNLVGESGYEGKPIYQGLETCLSLPGVYPHLYGKSQTRPFRKMGHATVVADSLPELQQKVSFVQNHLKVIA